VRGGLELLHGDLAAGERLAEQAFQLGQEAEQPESVMLYGAQIAFIRFVQGHSDQIIETLRQGTSAFDGVPSLRAGLATALCWLDLHDGARAILEQAASDRFEHRVDASDAHGAGSVRRRRVPSIRPSRSRDAV
jgi:hypothetical protein